MSSILSGTYDVFLNFRGIDTRYGFTAYLYKALCDEGIRTFFDQEELQEGEQISEAILNAIKNSKTAIVVFSENYASSLHCLNELVAILEYSSQNALVVLPVFYKVDPCEVRHQTGKYGEALANHCLKTRHEASVLDKWKEDLTKVADLKGFTVQQGDEHDRTINNIVVKVFSVIKDAPLQRGPLLRYDNVIKSMEAKQVFSQEFMLTFGNEQNRRTFLAKMTITVEDQQTTEQKTITVEFQLRKHCQPGEDFFVVGDAPELGSWNPSEAIKMTWSEGHVWTAHLDIPAGKPIQFKFILKGGNYIIWEQGPNRTLQPHENMSGKYVYSENV